MFNIYFLPRGHSRNWPKGGRNSRNVTPWHVLLTIFLSWCSERVKKPNEKSLSAVFCTKLHYTQIIALDWFDHMNWQTVAKNSFSTVQRVVSRPLRPLARMAPGIFQCYCEYIHVCMYLKEENIRWHLISWLLLL